MGLVQDLHAHSVPSQQSALSFSALALVDGFPAAPRSVQPGDCQCARVEAGATTTRLKT